MRAILNIANPAKPKVLRVCGSITSSIRTYAMLQCEVHKKSRKLAIAELSTARYIGDIVPAGEFTIIHAEK